MLGSPPESPPDVAAKYSMPVVANVTRTHDWNRGWLPLAVQSLAASSPAPAGPATAPSASTLTQGQTQPILAAATSAGSFTGAKISLSSKGMVQSSNLPGASLAITDGPPTWLSAAAINSGWFSNAPSGSCSAFSKPGDPAVQGHMDLLTVLANVLGISENPLNKEGMAENLAVGGGPTPTVDNEDSLDAPSSQE